MIYSTESCHRKALICISNASMLSRSLRNAQVRAPCPIKQTFLNSATARPCRAAARLSTMAVTPMPPAVQTEIRPRPVPRRRASSPAPSEDACPGSGKRMADGDTAALAYSACLGRWIPGLAPDPVARGRSHLTFPRLQGRQGLCRKGFMNLVQVEILQAESRVAQHFWILRKPAPSAGRRD